jgi:integrase
MARGDATDPDTPRFLDGCDLARVVKRIISLAIANEDSADPDALKLNAAGFAAHALRRGFATAAINKGVRRSLVREHGGWKTDAMLDRYTRVDQSRDNAVGELFKMSSRHLFPLFCVSFEADATWRRI